MSSGGVGSGPVKSGEPVTIQLLVDAIITQPRSEFRANAA